MKLYHPMTKLIMLFSAAVITMFARSASAACISAVLALVTQLMCEGRQKAFKTAGLTLMFTALMALTNPLFAHEGATPLLFVGRRVYTLEALIYGASAGLTLSAAIIWLGLLNVLLPKQEQLYLFGKLSPKLGLTISMTLGLIPRMRRKLGQIGDAQKTSGIYSHSGTMGQLRSSAAEYSALAVWAAESSADTALAMSARCYGRKKMTCSLAKPLRGRDIGVMLLSVGLSAAALWLYKRGGEFAYYPRITAGGSEGEFSAVFALLAALPAIILTKEKLKWRLYTARTSASPTAAAKSPR